MGEGELMSLGIYLLFWLSDQSSEPCNAAYTHNKNRFAETCWDICTHICMHICKNTQYIVWMNLCINNNLKKKDIKLGVGSIRNVQEKVARKSWRGRNGEASDKIQFKLII